MSAPGALGAGVRRAPARTRAPDAPARRLRRVGLAAAPSCSGGPRRRSASIAARRPAAHRGDVTSIDAAGRRGCSMAPRAGLVRRWPPSAACGDGRRRRRDRSLRTGCRGSPARVVARCGSRCSACYARVRRVRARDSHGGSHGSLGSRRLVHGRASWRAMSRFAEPQDPVFRALNASLGFDRRLWPHDIAQSRAHARMLAAREIITDDDRDALLAASTRVEARARRGRFPFRDDDEDIHMAVERRLTEIVGPVGGRLHTARSRNDQVATDVAMFTRERARGARAALQACRRALVRRRRGAPRLADARLHAPAARPAGVPLAPPAGLLLDVRCATASASRFVERRRGACRSARARWPGVNFDTDRRHGRRASSASRASRRTRSTRSPTATSCSTSWPPRRPARRTSRGWAPRSCCGRARSSASASCRTRGRRARRSCRRRRTRTPPSCCAPRRRGSSAHLAALHGVMHALPLTYNKDLQEDKEHLFDAVDTLELCLAAATRDGRRGALRPRAAWPTRPPTS